MKKAIAALILLSFGFGPIAHGATLKSQFEGLVAKNKLAKSAQSMCVADAAGIIASSNPDLRIIPASVSKIYTTDWAIESLPADFRYATEFFVNGKTLYINGTADPHFVIEHLDKILNEVHDIKRVTISKIVFSPNFYFNWKKTPEDIQKSMTVSIAERTELPVSKTLTIEYSPNAYSGKGTQFEFKSAPLIALLKQMNDYSTNISADVLFAKLGGPEAFAKYMKDTYGVGPETILFKNGSGLPFEDKSGYNVTTCALTLRVLKHLQDSLAEKDLSITDVLSAPAADPGVLMKRAFDLNLANAMVAKSGFVFNHSTLAGAIKTHEGLRYFGVFTDYPNLAKTESVRWMVDTFTNSLLKSFQSNLKPFDYASDPESLEDVNITRK